MRRYRFLDKTDVYESLNMVRDAFLAAKDSTEVEKIINGLLTLDERLKIGRRLIIASALESQMTIEEICQILKVGRHTVNRIAKELDKNDEWYTLVVKRSKKVDKEYQSKKYVKSGGSTLVFKKKTYSGFSKKQVKR